MNFRTSRGLLGASAGVSLLLPAVGWAQLGTEETSTAPRPIGTPSVVTVTTTPPGAIVTLDGQGIRLVGRSPWTITRGLDGVFRLRSELDVHETASATVYLSPTDDETIHMDLAPKTPVKAVMRSILVPGWGQHYAGRNAAGAVFFGSAVAAGAYLGVTAIRYEEQIDELEIAWEAYAESSVQSEREELWEVVEAEREIAQDRKNARTTAWAILGVVWGANLIDTLFFFPDANPPVITRRGTGTGLYVEPRSDGMDLGLRLGY